MRNFMEFIYTFNGNFFVHAVHKLHAFIQSVHCFELLEFATYNKAFKSNKVIQTLFKYIKEMWINWNIVGKIGEYITTGIISGLDNEKLSQTAI